MTFVMDRAKNLFDKRDKSMDFRKSLSEVEAELLFMVQQAVTELALEHYPEMAQKVLDELGHAAAERFQLSQWRIVHRYGVLGVSETIVWVGAVADHRGEAISACEFMMDSLKTDAPFWKREQRLTGEQWVTSRDSDNARRARWQSVEVE